MAEIYETLWKDAVAAFERGEPQVDAHLSDRANDLRRGVTLILRPSPSVRDAVADYLHRLTAVCPGQHFYHPEELHVTVLSIISGTEHWQHEMDRIPDCRHVIGEVLSRHTPFKMLFRGVTASPASVLIQGFPADESLAAIREDLREAFAQNGLGDMLDRRYKITGAHMSAMRFRKPVSDLKPLLAFLKESRGIPFGECEIQQLQLIFDDWYASAEQLQLLQEYPLKP
jgi:2'-5' RNA ligase